MREIKFRAIYKSDLEEDSGAIIFEQKEIDYELFFVNGDIQYDFAIPFLDKDWLILQFTGLKDKNGTEICEGDILKGYNCGRIVEWEGIGWNPFEDDVIDAEDSVRYEVIGNIYENPELLI